MINVGLTLLYIFLCISTIYVYLSTGFICYIKKARLITPQGMTIINQLLYVFIIPIYSLLEISKMASLENVQIYWILAISTSMAIMCRWIVAIIFSKLINSDYKTNSAYCLINSYPAIGPLTLVLGKVMCYEGAPMEKDPLCKNVLGLMMINYLIYAVNIFLIGSMIHAFSLNKYKKIKSKLRIVYYKLLYNNYIYKTLCNKQNLINDKINLKDINQLYLNNVDKYYLKNTPDSTHKLTNINKNTLDDMNKSRTIYFKDYIAKHLIYKYIKNRKEANNLFVEFSKSNYLEVDDNFNYKYINLLTLNNINNLNNVDENNNHLADNTIEKNLNNSKQNSISKNKINQNSYIDSYNKKLENNYIKKQTIIDNKQDYNLLHRDKYLNSIIDDRNNSISNNINNINYKLSPTKYDNKYNNNLLNKGIKSKSDFGHIRNLLRKKHKANDSSNKIYNTNKINKYNNNNIHLINNSKNKSIILNKPESKTFRNDITFSSIIKFKKDAQSYNFVTTKSNKISDISKYINLRHANSYNINMYDFNKIRSSKKLFHSNFYKLDNSIINKLKKKDSKNRVTKLNKTDNNEDKNNNKINSENFDKVFNYINNIEKFSYFNNKEDVYELKDYTYTLNFNGDLKSKKSTNQIKTESNELKKNPSKKLTIGKKIKSFFNVNENNKFKELYKINENDEHINTNKYDNNNYSFMQSKTRKESDKLKKLNSLNSNKELNKESNIIKNKERRLMFKSCIYGTSYNKYLIDKLYENEEKAHNLITNKNTNKNNCNFKSILKKNNLNNKNQNKKSKDKQSISFKDNHSNTNTSHNSFKSVRFLYNNPKNRHSTNNVAFTKKFNKKFKKEVAVIEKIKNKSKSFVVDRKKSSVYFTNILCYYNSNCNSIYEESKNDIINDINNAIQTKKHITANLYDIKNLDNNYDDLLYNNTDYIDEEDDINSLKKDNKLDVIIIEEESSKQLERKASSKIFNFNSNKTVNAYVNNSNVDELNVIQEENYVVNLNNSCSFETANLLNLNDVECTKDIPINKSKFEIIRYYNALFSVISKYFNENINILLMSDIKLIDEDSTGLLNLEKHINNSENKNEIENILPNKTNNVLSIKNYIYLNKEFNTEANLILSKINDNIIPQFHLIDSIKLNSKDLDTINDLYNSIKQKSIYIDNINTKEHDNYFEYESKINNNEDIEYCNTDERLNKNNFDMSNINKTIFNIDNINKENVFIVYEESINYIKITFKSFLQKIINPPIFGSFLGLLLGISNLSSVLFSNNHYLENMVEGLHLIGRMYVPLILFCCGFTITKAPKRISTNFSLSKSEYYLTYILSYLVFPIVGYGFIYFFSNVYGGIISNSLVYKFCIYCPFCIPIGPQFLIIVNSLEGFYIEEYSFLLSMHIFLMIITTTILVLIFFIIIV